MTPVQKFGSILGLLVAPVWAANVAGIDVPAPLPPQAVSDTYWGVKVPDPWRHLEDVANPDVQRWMRAQANATAAILGKIPGRKPLLDRILQLEGSAGGLTSTVIRTDNGRLFFLRRDPGENQFKLVWRDGEKGLDQVLIDPEALSHTAGQPQAIMDFQPSRDGRLLAYSLQAGGGEIGRLHVIDVASGKPVLEPIDRIRYASVSWLDDGSGFFYSRLREGFEKLPATERFGDRTLHFRSLGAGGVDRAVMSASRNPELQLPTYASPFVFQLPGTQTAAALIFLGVERNLMLFVADLKTAMAGEARWRPVFGVGDEVVAVHGAGDWLYLKSAKGAPRYQVLRLPLAEIDMKAAQVAVAQGDGAIGDMGGARDGLYFTRRDGVNTALFRLAHAKTAAPEPVRLPFAGSVNIKSAGARSDGAVVSLVGWTRASKDYAVDGKGVAALLPLAKAGVFDAPDDIVAREVMVRSHDGTEVPLSIVARRDAKLDGSNPLILYGYGAYGVTDDPFFSPRVYAWIERGGVWATVHVRGGGVFGKGWHEAGRKTTKPNTWKDAIAAGDWLVDQGWTAKQRMAIYGGSAGGIFVGRAIIERPDLFAAAVPAVGVMDAVRMESSANGVANIPEFGTVKKEEEFKALLEMSSYHQLKDGTNYPSVMLVHGVNDIRVDVWQSAKFASRLVQASASGKLVLMRLEYDSGHGQGSTRAQSQQRSADIWSYLLWQFGVPDFQPR